MSDIITLDTFLSSSPVPYTKKLQKFTFTKINGKPFNGYIFRAKKCLTLNQLTKHIPNGKYPTVLAAFQRAKKDFKMKEGIDYEKVSTKNFLALKNYRGEYAFLVYQTGSLLTLSKMSKKFNATLLYKLVHYYFDMEEKKQQFLNYQPQDVLDLPRMGKMHYTKNMDLVRSRGEQIIADIFFDLGVPYQTNVYFPEYGFNCDFIMKTEPRTVVEYWGMDTPDYLRKRKRKEEKYKKLGWNLFGIEPDEVENIPKLTERIRRYFLNKFI